MLTEHKSEMFLKLVLGNFIYYYGSNDRKINVLILDLYIITCRMKNPVLRLNVNSKYTEDMFNGFPVLLDTSK